MTHRVYTLRQKQLIINFVKTTSPDIEQLKDFISLRCDISWNTNDKKTYEHLCSILNGKYWGQ
jgi:calcineurin-like phosphoesterase family protein